MKDNPKKAPKQMEKDTDKQPNNFPIIISNTCTNYELLGDDYDKVASRPRPLR